MLKFASALTSACVSAHSAGLNLRTSNGVPSPPPPALSYHIHIVFDLSLPESLDAAIVLRDESRAYFSDMLGPDCDGRFDNGHLCLIYDHDIAEVLDVGPFPSGEWSMFVPVSYVDAVLFWFTQHYKEVPSGSLLLHPNTGYEYEDHSIWALWAGDAWTINMDIFEEGVQENEFFHHPGDAANPVCLPL